MLSGVIVDNLSYEWIFWLGLVFIATAIVAAFLWVPESPIKSPARIDWIGAGLLSATLVSLLVGVSEANSWAGARRRSSPCSPGRSRSAPPGSPSSDARPSPWSTSR